MGYLRQQDYFLLIQPSELNQMTTQSTAVLSMAESMAIEEMVGHLKQRYDVAAEFQPTTPWDSTLTYNAAALVEINFPAYSTTSTYALKALVVQNGVGYICTTAIVVPEAFTIGHWTVVGNQYDLYYAINPKPVFDYKAYYKPGDQVFWKNSIYTCLIETKIPDHFTQLQYSSIANIPLYNIFPDDPLNGIANWGTPVAYVVPINTPLSNTTYWQKGDNRSQICVYHAVAIALYNLAPRVAPQNVPSNRMLRYKEAVNWLMAVSQGDLNAEIPEIQPNTGNPIVSGGAVKRINEW